MKRACFICDGTGQMCDICGESESVCSCSADEYRDCADCDGTGIAASDLRQLEDDKKPRMDEVTVTFKRSELEALLAGLRRDTRLQPQLGRLGWMVVGTIEGALAGIPAQPVSISAIPGSASADIEKETDYAGSEEKRTDSACGKPATRPRRPARRVRGRNGRGG